MQYPDTPYADLLPDELMAEHEKLARELSAAQVELSEVRVQYMWIFGQAYKASAETSVSGREREAEIATAAIREDEIKLIGQIEALTTMTAFLSQLVALERPVRMLTRAG